MRQKLSTLLLLGLFVLAEPLQAIAQQSPQPPQWHWQGPWHGTQFWWICPLMILFMFLVFGAIFFFVRRSWPEGRRHWGSPWHMMDRAWGPPIHSALQILNERFARGEIEKGEYEDRKAAILSGEQR